MSNTEQSMRDALAQIAKIAGRATGLDEFPDDHFEPDGRTTHRAPIDAGVCIPKTLPSRLLVKAAETAVRINPVNAPFFGPMVAAAAEVSDPLRIAVLTAKYWGPSPRRLSVSFMEPTPADLRRRIVSHMNAWTRTGNIQFSETTGTGDVRISRGQGGYWSYLGTDILQIPRNRQTMNLEGFTMNTPESEYKRVVRHETGHTLGFPHEHMRRELVARIDPNRAYEYFLRTQGWDRATVDQQVLSSLDERSIMGTPADQTSIMCYQLPASITRDNQPILGGLDINATDYGFAGRIYPRSGHHEPMMAEEEDWEADGVMT